MAAALDTLGYAHQHLGHHAEAVSCYQQALDLHLEVSGNWGAAALRPPRRRPARRRGSGRGPRRLGRGHSRSWMTSTIRTPTGSAPGSASFDAAGDPAMPPAVRVRRVYDQPEPQDGRRVLVDRLWPRGLRKDAGRFDEWAKDVAPSSELRTWYGHDPEKFGEFCRRYTAELAQGTSRAALDHLAALAAAGPVTLLTATRDVGHSEAVVLAQLLQRQPSGCSRCRRWRGGLLCPPGLP